MNPITIYNKGAEYYRIQDPSENLKIKINIRQVFGQLIPVNANNGYNESVTISWQEKIYGPKDIFDYMLNKKSSRGTQSQLDNRKKLGTMERNGRSVEDMLQSSMLYTYTNEDSVLVDKVTDNLYICCCYCYCYCYCSYY